MVTPKDWRYLLLNTLADLIFLKTLTFLILGSLMNIGKSALVQEVAKAVNDVLDGK